MAEKIVFTKTEADFLKDEDCTVEETFDLEGFEYFAAAVETENPEELSAHPEVDEVKANIEFNLRTNPEATEKNWDKLGTMEDVRNLHNCPDKGNTGKGLTVAATDSGIDTSHPVFKDRKIEQVDVTGKGTGDSVGHGTAVFGQITRIAPDADLISIRIFGDKGSTSFKIILRAYEWLFKNADKVDIVNMSWGASKKVQRLDDLQNKLVEKGVRDVTAAGNSGGKGGSPGTAEKAFSVGACDERGNITDFTSYNPEHDNPDVTAIGKNNRLAQGEGTTMGKDLPGPWTKASGTSFAAPEVAGMVAKLLETEDVDVIKAFEDAARDVEKTPREGVGLVDYKAIGKEKEEEPKNPTAGGEVWSFVGNDVFYVGADWLESGDYDFELTKDGDKEKQIKVSPK